MTRLNMALACRNCGHAGLKPMFDPDEPPDPDRHGNRRAAHSCPSCGARGSIASGGQAGRFTEGCVRLATYKVPLP